MKARPAVIGVEFVGTTAEGLLALRTARGISSNRLVTLQFSNEGANVGFLSRFPGADEEISMPLHISQPCFANVVPLFGGAFACEGIFGATTSLYALVMGAARSLGPQGEMTEVHFATTAVMGARPALTQLILPNDRSKSVVVFGASDGSGVHNVRSMGGDLIATCGTELLAFSPNPKRRSFELFDQKYWDAIGETPGNVQYLSAPRFSSSSIAFVGHLVDGTWSTCTFKRESARDHRPILNTVSWTKPIATTGTPLGMVRGNHTHFAFYAKDGQSGVLMCYEPVRGATFCGRYSSFAAA